MPSEAAANGVVDALVNGDSKSQNPTKKSKETDRRRRRRKQKKNKNQNGAAEEADAPEDGNVTANDSSKENSDPQMVISFGFFSFFLF